MFNPYPYPQFPTLPGGAMMPQMPQAMQASPQMPMGQQQNPATAGMGARPIIQGMPQQQQPGGMLSGINPQQLMGLLNMFKGGGVGVQGGYAGNMGGAAGMM